MKVLDLSVRAGNAVFRAVFGDGLGRLRRLPSQLEADTLYRAGSHEAALHLERARERGVRDGRPWPTVHRMLASQQHCGAVTLAELGAFLGWTDEVPKHMHVCRTCGKKMRGR